MWRGTRFLCVHGVIGPACIPGCCCRGQMAHPEASSVSFAGGIPARAGDLTSACLIRKMATGRPLRHRALVRLHEIIHPRHREWCQVHREPRKSGCSHPVVVAEAAAAGRRGAGRRTATPEGTVLSPHTRPHSQAFTGQERSKPQPILGLSMCGGPAGTSSDSQGGPGCSGQGFPGNDPAPHPGLHAESIPFF